MKQWWITLGLLVISSVFALAQQSSSTPPAGTKVQERQSDTLVQPVPKPVKITRQMVMSAQQALEKRGYDAGPIDGVEGPRTHAAVSKFQADAGLARTGRLDVDTMQKLNVGGIQTLGAAPADVGRGGKAFGHNIKEGHPVAASKGLGKGAVNSGKKVAKGSESLAKEGAEKIGSGMSKIGRKIEGKSEGEPKTQNPPPQQSQTPPPR